MKEAILLAMHLLTTIAKFLGPGGGRSVIVENLLLKHQLLIHSRSRQRSPNLSVSDRALLGFWTLFLNPRRMARAAILVKPSTLLNFHAAMKRRKYRLLFSSRRGVKPGPKGPSKEVVDAIVAMKQRNPRFGCPRIAQQVNLAFGLNLNKDVVRRILANHYRPDPGEYGPSWLTMLGHTKDSLWSIDLFRCESILLKSHWVMVVMDQYTRRIIGFSVHGGTLDGAIICKMFNDATSGSNCPARISTDNDPLFQYHRWKANLRVLDIEEIKSLPDIPISHPFVERLIGSVRRELLDQIFFWTVTDLDNKLLAYQHYYNKHRCHSSRNGATPVEPMHNNVVDINDYHWNKHCRGLYELPVAA